MPLEEQWDSYKQPIDAVGITCRQNGNNKKAKHSVEVSSKASNDEPNKSRNEQSEVVDYKDDWIQLMGHKI